MAGTIQQIADLAGVSRGTVDRALNNRGRINPEVAERIYKIAQDLGYTSNRKKTAQAVYREELKLGVVTQLSRTPFMIQVNKGIEEARKELEARGITLLVRESKKVDENEQMDAIEELMEQNIHGLALMPVESDRIRSKINHIVDENEIPVVTFNSDIVGTKRCCFVGLDNKKSGRTAAGLMGMLTRGKGKILIITGFFSNSVNSLRVDGFIEEVKQSFPDLDLVGVQSSFDDANEVQKIIRNTIAAFPDLTGIFVASGGQEGVGEAFRELKLDQRPYVIIYDKTPENKQSLRHDEVDFLIDQEGYVQGYRPPHLLADLIRGGKQIEKELQYTQISILTKYNI